MFSFFQRAPGFGIEITAREVRAVALSASRRNRTVLTTASADLPAGAVPEAYSAAVMADHQDGLAGAVRKSLSGAGSLTRKASLCLPDTLFRIQTLDFDELPPRADERDRLIRWRLEKSAAFDLADTVLHHQVLRRPKGVTVLACVAKKALIRHFEAMLSAAGLEVWSIIPASLAVANFYAPLMAQRPLSYALSHVTGDFFSTIIHEKGGVSFYRSKDVKRGPGEASVRLTRDIADSLHFYAHRDRGRQTELRHLFLSGERELCDAVAGDLGTEAGLEVRVVSPEQVLPGSPALSGRTDLAAALGAALSV